MTLHSQSVKLEIPKLQQKKQTLKSEDFNLTRETVPKSKHEFEGNLRGIKIKKSKVVYLGQLFTKQKWSDEYLRNETPKYQIFVGNVVNAVDF